jgi:hypothetical protein
MGCGVEVADTGDVFDNLVLKVDIDKIPRGLYKIRFHVYLRSESRQSMVLCDWVISTSLCKHDAIR